jgi:hypothetical protein
MAANKGDKPLGAGELSATQVGQLLDISQQWISVMVKQGYFKRKRAGVYGLVDVVQGYIRYLKDEKKRNSKTAAMSRLQESKTELMQLELAAKRRELLPQDEVFQAFDLVVGTVVSELVTLPGRFTADAKTRRALEAIVDKSRNNIADELDAVTTALEKGDRPNTG